MNSGNITVTSSRNYGLIYINGELLDPQYKKYHFACDQIVNSVVPGHIRIYSPVLLNMLGYTLQTPGDQASDYIDVKGI